MLIHHDLRFIFISSLNTTQIPFNPSGILGPMSYANVDSFSNNLHKPTEYSIHIFRNYILIGSSFNNDLQSYMFFDFQFLVSMTLKIII